MTETNLDATCEAGKINPETTLYEVCGWKGIMKITKKDADVSEYFCLFCWGKLKDLMSYEGCTKNHLARAHKAKNLAEKAKK